MRIEEKILLNQLAQGILKFQEGERWFLSLGGNDRRAALGELNMMIVNTHPRKEDIPIAITSSGLKPTYTPCVLLQNGEILALGKIAGLPDNELLKAFRLLVALLSVSDRRRRTEKPLDTRNHWWHRDLSDLNVIAAIKQEFGST
jgi:hypothetical protein